MSIKRKKKSDEYGIVMKCRLKVFRAEYDLTQEDVAKKLGVTRQTISSIEKGKYNPSIILAYKIAKLFDVSIEEMFIFTRIDEKKN